MASGKLPVSQVMAPVGSTDMFEEIVYVAWFSEHDARTSMADGVTDNEV
jgi:hypothetical protein